MTILRWNPEKIPRHFFSAKIFFSNWELQHFYMIFLILCVVKRKSDLQVAQCLNRFFRHFLFTTWCRLHLSLKELNEWNRSTGTLCTIGRAALQFTVHTWLVAVVTNKHRRGIFRRISLACVDPFLVGHTGRWICWQTVKEGTTKTTLIEGRMVGCSRIIKRTLYSVEVT